MWGKYNEACYEGRMKLTCTCQGFLCLLPVDLLNFLWKQYSLKKGQDKGGGGEEGGGGRQVQKIPKKTEMRYSRIPEQLSSKVLYYLTGYIILTLTFGVLI